LPLVVQPGGKITLAAINPLTVEGLTLEETASLIQQTYLQEEIIRDRSTYPVVNMMRPRTYQVTVIREDTGQRGALLGNDLSATGASINLPAYKNDVLNALMATGGLPGLGAKNEIRIYKRGSMQRINGYDPSNSGVQDYRIAGSSCLNIDPLGLDGPDVIIPLRVPAGSQLDIDPSAIILDEGDVVYIANRTSEVFYTAGMLPGGQHQLPRDQDIDVFAAMAMAGYSYGQADRSGGGLVPSTGIVPSQLYIFRQRPDGSQFAIDVDLPSAVSNERERLLIQPGDRLILRYTPKEEIMNFSIFAFFTYGIRELFQ
jgi:protein involved in polysaccharide export with SLBB domain